MSFREPSNRAIAALLSRHAQLLQIAGESSFRARAYSRAAEAIGDTPEPVVDLLRSGRLREIPGIGEGIAAAISDIVATGSFPERDELTNSFPETLLELLQLSGVGVKTARLLFEQHAIDGIDALEELIESGGFDQLSGMNARTKATLISGVEEFRERSGSFPLGLARPLAMELSQTLQQKLPNAVVELTGAVRRWDVSVSEIDLAIGSDSRDEVFNVLSHAGLVGRIERKIDHDAGIHESGIPVRIFVASREDWGSNLVRTTGSPGHLQLLPEVPSGLATEVEVYAVYGLPWIPPELRQGTIEVANAAQIPTLVTLTDIKGQLHSHTRWSDGSEEVIGMARAAAERGYEYLGITDHSQGLGVAGGLSRERLHQQWDEIDALQEVDGVRLLKGAEVEVHRDGRLDYDDATLAQLDVVVASLHSGLRLPRPELMGRLLTVLHSAQVDILAHPSGRLIGRRSGGDFDWPSAFEAASISGTALEINSDPGRLDLDPSLAIVASAAGCRFTINSDAHSANGFDNLDYGVTMARKAWLKPDQIVNCWERKKLLTWLASRANTS